MTECLTETKKDLRLMDTNVNKCTTNIALCKGHLEWTIENFNNLETVTGIDLKSGTFNASLKFPKWNLRLCVYGKETKDYIGLFLEKKNDWEAFVRCQFWIKNGKNERINLQSYEFYYDKDHHRHGDSEFIARISLKDDDMLPNNSLKVGCEIIIPYHAIIEHGDHRPMSPLDGMRNHIACKNRQFSFLERDLRNLLGSSQYSDVTLASGESSFPSHKSILAARSKVFANLLFDNPPKQMEESNTLVLDPLAPDVLKEMLSYIYTGRIAQTINTDSVEALLKASVNYSIEGLQSLCVARLIENLTLENVARTLLFAVNHKLLDLKDEAMRFIKNNSINDVLHKANLPVDLQQRPDLLFEIWTNLAALLLEQNVCGQCENKIF